MPNTKLNLMAPDEVPTYLEPLIGWRTWTLEDTTERLRSRDPWAISPESDWTKPSITEPVGPMKLVSGGATEWPLRERLTAVCRNGQDHRSPEPRCRCGIYAAASHQVLRDRGYAAGPDDHRAPDLVGELWMWGRVMQSDDILRAEFAYPKRLFVPFRTWKKAKPLTELYGVPVLLKNPFTMNTDPGEEDR